jgi:choline dehydrogenase-like flavoprotein
MRTLAAICEALLPSCQPPEGEADPHGLYACSAADLDIARLLAETVGQDTPEARASFKQLLGLLNSAAGGLLIASRPVSIARMPLAAREAALRKMSTHRMAMLRQGFQALKRLSTFTFYATPDPASASGDNPNWPALGFTPPPPPPSPEATPKRIRTLPVGGDLALTADAVVVGSGAGGGVVAAELAAAGKDVLVIEKGGYYNESDFTGREADMMPQLYLRRGALTTSDLGMTVLAGSCLGGGTVVNWSTSLRTPDDVLAEWERQHGLTGATSADYAAGFDVVERRLGINTADSEPNANNAALKRGCDALGYANQPIPRNASDCHQRCGACGYGCPYGRKQSTMLTFLQDAADRGARVLVRCTVERLLIEAGRVVGVEGWAPDDTTGERRKVTVRAPLVVVSAGSVESPALLVRSGLTNSNIGRHLRLHPVTGMAGYYEDDILPWTGSLQTIYSPHFADLGNGYGLRFEVMPGHPGLMASLTPWTSGQQHKREMTRLRHAADYIVLTRDTGEGRVTVDRRGEPIIAYWPNETDRRHLIKGIQEVTRIIFAGGGVRASTLHTPPLILESEGSRPGAVSSARLNTYLVEMETRGIVLNRVGLGTAHQMGTCRLGASPASSVADPTGAVHGVRGLYIADASGFPSASGVNPMLSTMTLAYWVAQHAKTSA